MAYKLNDKQIRALLKQGKPGHHNVARGLYFRISNEGTGFWSVKYTIMKRRREMSIGRFPELSLADANLKSLQIAAEVRQGIDPLEERERESNGSFQIIDNLAEDWLKDCHKRLKHPKIPQRVYRKEIAPIIGKMALVSVKPLDVRRILNLIVDSNRPTIANDTLGYLKQMFRHGIKLGLLESNPAEAFSYTDAGGVEKSRSRALSFDEIKTTFKILRDNTDQFVPQNYLALCLLLSLGIRKEELVAAKWKEFDLDKQTWHLTKERTKTGAEITIPLSSNCVMWLNTLKVLAFGSEFVFPNRRASKRSAHMSHDTLNAAVNKQFNLGNLSVEHFTIHDLRRTCRSLLAEIGTPSHIAERCVNHKIKGVEGIYDRYDYFDERKKALKKLSTRLEIFI
ncbi:tyrosine-type recombinase/integrase [Thalassotalea psychrophila]|uniref:Tyrosine-type recombinase/integrase n=1 Tax=Thalassotalea psychrophila TaxID=3065647 RepID=A0ABY9TV64_9GAMM|nr:tyrosine-type recombinase/integrase [Colwelliaceae bacterium SQ149]